MIGRSFVVLAAVACLATAPAAAQAPVQRPRGAPQQPTSPHPAGPRLEPAFKSYKPKFSQEQQSLAATAAADKTTITISTLGLVLLIVLLILLIT